MQKPIILIQDFPGKPEITTQKPLAGVHENMLKGWWAKHGLYRDSFHVFSLLDRTPRGNNMESVGVDELVEAIKNLHFKLASYKPNVIVTVDNYTTYALTGKGKVKAALRKALGEEITSTEAEKKASITSLRGSTYLYKGIKVIPTIHPREIIKYNLWRKRTKRDWKIIAEESKFPEYYPLEDEHIISPSEDELNYLLDLINRSGDRDALAVDIETAGDKITCVGFCLNPGISYTLPLSNESERESYLPWIKEFCEHPIAKVLANGLYDRYYLKAYGIGLTNFKWDVQLMHHAFDPIEQHSLAFLLSYFTRYNYHKDEHKDSDKKFKYLNDLQALYAYNGMDCTRTRFLFDVLLQELVKRNMLDFYIRHYATMTEPIGDIMSHGVAVVVKRQKAWAKKLIGDAEDLRAELAEKAGEDLFAKKSFSPDKLKRFFYETLGLPEQNKMSKRKAGMTRIVAIDEIAIKKMTLKYPKKIEDWGLKALRVRKLLKKASVLKKGWDKDGRIRCSYKLNTEQGRLSSSKNPMRRGYNLQNIEREAGGIRSTFLPDPECIFVRVDLSQSEDRFCKMYTRSPRLVEQANLRPHEWDSHTNNTKIIFGDVKITKEIRQLGKVTTHASQRAMAGATLANNLLSDFDIIKSPKQCQTMIEKYHVGVPEIRSSYFPFVESQVISSGILGNSWGRIIDFRGFFIDNNLFRKAYSFYLQSENADLLNQRGMKYIYYYIKDNHLKSRVNLNVHDEIIVSCPPDEAYQVAKVLVKSLETPRRIMGNWLRVPADLTIGTTWDSLDCYEFKMFPEEDEFRERMEVLINGNK